MDPLDRMARVVDDDMNGQTRGARRGEISVFVCPECGGGLWQVDEKDPVRFRCHVGHTYYGVRTTVATRQSSRVRVVQRSRR